LKLNIIRKIDFIDPDLYKIEHNLLMDKSSINIFEVKIAIKDLPFKISAADVFN